MATPSTNHHETTSMQHQDSNQIHLATQEITMETKHVNKKPVKRIVPEKIAEVGQWRDKVVTEEDKTADHKDDKAVNQENNAEMSTEDAKMN